MNKNNPYKRTCVNGKYKFNHRLIMEAHLNRKLEKHEIIHHKDNNKLNNAVDNLELTTHKKHSLIHKEDHNVIYKTFSCYNCGKEFDMRKKLYNWKQTKSKTKKIFCSKKCAQKHNKKYLKKKNYIYRKYIKEGLSHGLTGYKISKTYNIPKSTTYYLIKIMNM